MIRTNSYDDQALSYFLFNEGRIRTEDAEPDEFSPEAIFDIEDDAETHEDIS